MQKSILKETRDAFRQEGKKWEENIATIKGLQQ
jgi:hypothetical protein